jgi:hypothetical protein
MKIKQFFILTLLAIGNHIVAQSLKKSSLTKYDSAVHIVAKYEYVNRHDGFERIYLFKNKTFKYDYEWTSIGHKFSNGRWEIRDSELILRSAIRKDSIPVKIKFLDTMQSRRHYKTGFQIPINLRGELLPDSRIFINDTFTFVFPYFDTLIGNYGKINRIMIAFGNGFKSPWVPMPQSKFNELLVIAQINFTLASYVGFKNKRFRILNKSIVPEDE